MRVTLPQKYQKKEPEYINNIYTTLVVPNEINDTYMMYMISRSEKDIT